ncbi:hypothetical protein M8J76_002821 [Diaphorina citri]|nr:hypothetical protein M8J76_002821 [Diaphorina citri]
MARNDQRTEETKTNKAAGPVVTPRKSKTDKLESVRFDESNSLLISPFMITQKFGTVLPHEVVFIPVTCNVEAQSSYSETILCTISNQPPGFEPVSIEMSAQGHLPEIQLDNLNFIFQEANIIGAHLQPLVDGAEGFLSAYTVFATEDRTLLFANVPIGESSQIDLRLYNSAYAKNITKSSARRKEKQSVDNPNPIKQEDVFDVDAKEFTIAPHSHRKVQLTFKPASIEDYKGTVDITLPARPGMERFSFTVLGQVTVPQISILEPRLGDDLNLTLSMNPTLVGRRAMKSLKFQNTSKVILELLKNESDVFKVIPLKETVPLLLMETEEVLYTTVLSLKPGVGAEFRIEFAPESERRFTGEIHLYIKNNMYEKFVIYMIGIGHDDHLHIEGLDAMPLSISYPPPATSPSVPPTPHTKSPTRRNKNVSPTPLQSGDVSLYPVGVHNYRHDFGALPLGEEKWHRFELGNVSDDYTWRYTIVSETADVVVTVSCSLVPIVLVQSLTDQDSNSYNWDIGQSIKPDITLLNARDMKPQSSKKEATEVFKSPPQTKKGKSKSQMAKSVASIPSVVSTPINPWGEPKYETLRKEEPKTLTIYVKYVSDVTKYVVPESGLDFYYCPCYQDKTMRLRVLNTGLVPVTLTTSLLLETYGQLSSGPPVSEMVAISSTPVEDFAQPDSPVTEPLHTVVKDRRFLQYKPGKNNSGSDDQEPSEPKPVECPFSISPPDIVTIEPGQICVYDVKFRPTLALSYRANLNFYRIPIDSSMEADSQTCTLEGAGSMPWVHLEIPESDLAVTSEVRNSLGASVGGALSWDQRCLGFNVLGEDKAHVIRIKMTNVSPVKYSYTWRPISDQSDSCVPTPSCFEVIEKSEGHLSPGEQSWIEFTFHPYALGIYEARWNLTLSGDRTTAFLLVGVAREPNVRFDNNYLKLSPAFVGMLSSDHICIKNNESCELAFKFIASSLYNEGKQEILQVFPSSGVMKPISHNPVRIEFVPRSSGDFVFNIQCAVTNMLTPLELCVTCRVYPVNVTVTLTTDLGESVELYPNEDNVFDIGKINIHVRTLYQYRIANASIKGVAYHWSLAFNYHKTPLDIEIGNPTGRVAAQSDYGDQFSLLAHRNCVFDNVTLVLYIKHGPRYVIKLKGIAHNLPYHIWPKVVNFDTCLITGDEYGTEEDRLKYSIMVQCKNYSQEDVVIESYYKDTPYLQVDILDQSIPPDRVGAILITFNPLQPKSYREIIDLLVNGKYLETLKVSGKGVELKVRILNGEKVLNFGDMKIGTVVKRTIQLLNESESSVSLKFDLCTFTRTPPDMSLTSPPAELLAQNAEDHSHEQCCEVNDTFKVLPRTLDLLPRETKSVTIQCKPTSVEKNIQLWFILNFESIRKNLCLIKGNVIGTKFLLDRPLISFNPTKRTSTSVEKLILINDGDEGAKFEWSIEQKSSNYFKISPMRGFSNPGSRVHFNVEFSPSRLILYLSCKAYCKIDKYGTLELKMAGSCVPLPKSKDAIEFSIPVRTTATKTITKEFPATEKLEAYLTGHFFTGVNKLVQDETNPTAISYEVTYAPLLMTSQHKLHYGYLKLCGDSNQHFVYRLVGKALPPLPNDRVSSSLLPLRPHVEPLLAQNWLPYNQKFECYYSFAEDDSENYFTAKIRDFIMLPANTSRTVEFLITPYRVGNLNVKVYMKNEDTQEYQWWDLNYEVSDNGEAFNTVDLTTYARQTVEYTILVDNPMIDATVFFATSNHPDLEVQSSVAVPGRQKGKLKVNYYSLLAVDQQEASIVVESPELGRTTHIFNLTALPPPSEKHLKFSAELGKSMSLVVELENLSPKNKTDFSLQVSHPDFLVDRSVPVFQGIKTPVTITYEPSSLHNCDALLQAKSQHAGIYTYSLTGEVIPPKPQGPYSIYPGDTIAIPFRNIFTEPKIFQYACDNPLFVLKTYSELVKNKKDTKITVSFSPSPDLDCKFPPVGKLIVSVADPKPEYAQMKWIFYLNSQC